MQVREISQAMGEAMMQTRQEAARSPTENVSKEKNLSKDYAISAQEGEQEIDRQTIGKVVGQIQEVLDRLNVRLVFNLDDKTGDIIVKVVDPKTNEVIRQIPPEELLKIREKLDELMGILFEARV